MSLSAAQIRVLGEVRLRRVPGYMAVNRASKAQVPQTVASLLKRGLIAPRADARRGPYKLTEAGRQALKDNL